MTHNKLAKILSFEFLVGLLLQLAGILVVVSLWKGAMDQKIITLEAQAEITTKDHDALINLSADVRAIKEIVTKIERRMDNQKDAKVGN